LKHLPAFAISFFRQFLGGENDSHWFGRNSLLLNDFGLVSFGWNRVAQIANAVFLWKMAAAEVMSVRIALRAFLIDWSFAPGEVQVALSSTFDDLRQASKMSQLNFQHAMSQLHIS